MLHRSRPSISRAASNPQAQPQLSQQQQTTRETRTTPASTPANNTDMVSHPDNTIRPPLLLFAPRAPTSVASSSRVSHSQRHHHGHSHSRSGRSHHGGSSPQPLNQFPIFAATGDVEIAIRASTQERRYLLHRLILARCSGFFDAGTSEEWSRVQALREMLEGDDGQSNVNSNETRNGNRENAPGERGLAIIPDEDCGDGELVSHHRRVSSAPTKTRWRYELDWKHREEDEVPILVQRPPSQSNTIFGGSYRPPQPPPARTKPPAPHQGFFRSITNLTGIQSALHLPSTATTSSTLATKSALDEQPLDPTIRDYDNLFRVFYNYPPQLNSINIASAYSECKSLLNLADMYDALAVVGPRVDHHLLRFSSRLYKQIAKYPPSYLRLGYLARSHVIFAEALIHVVGQWPAALPHLGHTSYSPLPDSVLDLIEDKVEDLEDLKARVEGKLFRLSLTTSRGERVSPTNAYLDWLAVSLFRQWLVENTTPPPQGILKALPAPQGRGDGGNNNNYNGSVVANNAYGNTSTVSTANNNATNNTHATATATTTMITTTSAGAAPTITTTNKTSSTSNTTTPSYSPGRTYRLLGSPSTQVYLPHDELKKFLKQSHSHSHDSLYSRDNLKRFERKMDEIKRLAREIVKPLMRNFLELDLRSLGGGGGGGEDARGGMLLPYLTCTRVEEGDYPW
ncbi:hypothetical protein ACO22_07131 [Paracoccidioides brasiliensis]|uniref:Uncharacterized protein n=1 Tax=Paracoccidioides brasiliensis TaxID=121759 RepID=A0A1D2J5I8_PARBR|nr:hypothetical protein ACO22_07131 [Paracoccidioides brasiliensis]ODH49411.1 hypothetical protein GX48_04496 [Paracoccidioides brasiliensis]